MIYVRNNIFYLSFTHEGKRVRISTKLTVNVKNKLFLEKNYKNVIDNYLQKKIKKINNKYFFNQKLEEYIQNKYSNYKKSTLETNFTRYKCYVKKFFYNIQMKEVNTLLIKKYINYLNELDIQKNLKRSVIGLVKDFCENSIEEEQMQEFFFPAIKLKTNKKNITNSNKTFTSDELKLFLADCSEFERLIFSIKFYTGVRNGELIALKWKDIDFKNETLLIRRNISAGVITSTKTNTERIIHLAPQVVKSFLILSKKYKNDDEFIFYSKKTNSHYKSSRIFFNRFNAICKKLKLEKKFYWTRHTYASLCLKKVGINLMPTISNQLGHKNINTTLKFYASYIENIDDIKKIKQAFQ